jgi:hypothetical protein
MHQRIDNEYDLKLKEMDTQAKLAIAEIETKAQNVSERLGFIIEELINQQHAQAHEAGLQWITTTRVPWRSSRTPIRCRKQSTNRTRWAWRKFSSPERLNFAKSRLLKQRVDGLEIAADEADMAAIQPGVAGE